MSFKLHSTTGQPCLNRFDSFDRIAFSERKEVADEKTNECTQHFGEGKEEMLKSRNTQHRALSSFTWHTIHTYIQNSSCKYLNSCYLNPPYKAEAQVQRDQTDFLKDLHDLKTTQNRQAVCQCLQQNFKA